MLPLFVLLSYFFAYWAFRRSQVSLALLIIILCSVSLKVWACSNPWLRAWDERYHALVAKNMLGHLLKPTLYAHPILPYDYQNWTENHVWLHKQPMALWLIALSLKLFGCSAFAVRLSSILCSTLSILLLYKIAASWFNRQVGLLSAFLLSINGLVLDLVSGNNSTDHVDVCFLYFVLLTVWLMVTAVQRRSIVLHGLGGVALGCAILTKWLPALIVLPVWLLLALPNYQGLRKVLAAHFLVFLIATFCIAAPWQFYIFSAFPLEASWEYHYNALHLTKVLEGHSGNWFYHFDVLRMCYGEAVYVAIIWFAVMAATKRTIESMIVFAWFIIPYLFFSFSATKMPAYTLISAPAVFMIIAVVFGHCVVLIRQRNKYRKLLGLVAICLIGLPVRYTIERLKPFDSKEEDKRKYRNVQAMKSRITHPERTIVYSCPYNIELMFFTGCTAYSRDLNSSELHYLRQEGFTVLKF